MLLSFQQRRVRAPFLEEGGAESRGGNGIKLPEAPYHGGLTALKFLFRLNNSPMESFEVLVTHRYC